MPSLSFTPFEESLYVDDCPAYPWNILFRLTFDGPLDRALWEKSLAAVAGRHPFLRAKVRRSKLGRFFWLWPDDGHPTAPVAVNWNEHAVGVWPALERLPIEQGRALDTWIADAPGRTEALLHFHHIAVDGLGAEQIIGDLLLAYDALARGVSPAWAQLDEASLRRRGTYGYNVIKFLRNLPKLSVGLRGVKQFLARKPVPLLPHEPAVRTTPLPTTYPAVRTHAFSAAETQALLAAARASGATLNDLLARDLFLALRAWRERRTTVPDDQWLRLLVPVNMRTPDDRTMPAANVMSTIFLDRDGAQLRGDAATLLQTVHDEMTLIKRNDLGLIYLLSLRVSGILPGAIERAARKQKFCNTAILTNILRPLDTLPLPRTDGRLQVGDVHLDDFEFFAPPRPLTCASFGISTYAGRLHVGLQADSRFLSASDIDELQADYIRLLSRSIATAT
ncbi:MAG: hypothetical protein C0483_12255 [Pirellula sp.]|nr:hypothetical protein [Pirellula sp.]